MCLSDRPYLSLVCDTGPSTGLCLCKAGWSQGLGDAVTPMRRGVLVPSGTRSRALLSDAHRGEAGLAGMLLPAAIGCVDWFLQEGEEHLTTLQEGARPRGRGQEMSCDSR